jgi:hypothetical protein
MNKPPALIDINVAKRLPARLEAGFAAHHIFR